MQINTCRLLVTELYAYKEQQKYATIDWTTASATVSMYCYFLLKYKMH